MCNIKLIVSLVPLCKPISVAYATRGLDEGNQRVLGIEPFPLSD